MGYANHMKTTLDISDNILKRAKRLARKRHVTLRSLTEEGLARMLEEGEKKDTRALRPVTFKGKGLTPEYAGAGWSQVRDGAYEGRGS